MSTAAPAIPRRWMAAVCVVLAALVMATLAPTVALADADAESAFVSAANRERAAAGLSPLAVADDLVAVARRHSATMADGHDLHHNPSLTSDVASWQRVGENVGRGPGTDAIHAAFMASPTHRANILEAGWTEVGIGVEAREGRIWVTQVFRLPADGADGAEDGAQGAPEAVDDPAASSRSLAMLSRVAATDAALDAASS